MTANLPKAVVHDIHLSILYKLMRVIREASNDA